MSSGQWVGLVLALFGIAALLGWAALALALAVRRDTERELLELRTELATLAYRVGKEAR